MVKNKKGAGPPVKYKHDYPWMARVVCEEGGFTDSGLAKLFRVCLSTINKWKHDYPEFKEAVREGKAAFDAKHVERALLKRAVGYSYRELIYGPGKNGKLVIQKRVQKHLAGDVNAQIFWLRNRNPKRWVDNKNLDIRGTVTHSGSFFTNYDRKESV